MKSPTPFVNEVKFILDDIRSPERLDDHAWTKSLLVSQAAVADPTLEKKSPGYRLLAVLSTLFRQMMPSTPPRRGKRLDTRWCQFGMLAAQYFAPFLFGTVYPTSLRDAWGRIDQATPLFVFGNSADDMPDDAVAPYRLFDDEAEPAPISTLSDWNQKGLERLTELFLHNEEYLSHKSATPSPVLHPAQSGHQSMQDNQGRLPSGSPEKPHSGRQHGKRSKFTRYISGALLIILAGAIVIAGFKTIRLYQNYKTFRSDLSSIQEIVKSDPGFSGLGKATPLVAKARTDLTSLESQAGPYLWIGKWLGWVPVYGGNLAQADSLLKIASGLIAAADDTLQAGAPLWEEGQAGGQSLKLPEMVQLLLSAQPKLTQANQALAEATAARKTLDLQTLTPSIRGLIEDQLDPNLPVIQDGLTLALTLPKLIGASSSGSQTYLILFQNEDELRATGGFITAAGTMVVKDGSILSFNVEDAYAFDDLSKPYPPAPWQLERYMEAQILLLRDSNWSPDFPTSATMAEYLYSYTRFNSVDGVIAIDQHAVQMLLGIFGPVKLEGVPDPITTENVVSYMHAAKYDTGTGPYDPNHRKDFIATLGEAILARIKTGQALSLDSLSKSLVAALNEKHIVLQLDDPSMSTILAEHDWDGAVRSGDGDYLMTVGSNIGYTKGSGVVDTKITYQVDLSNLADPSAELSIVQKNNAQKGAPCILVGASSDPHTYQDLIDRCYWEYLRVYKPAGTRLIDATPHAVPGISTLSGEPVPAQVDTLNEKIAGVQGYGTYLLIPEGSILKTSFRFSLPADKISTDPDSGDHRYILRVQKQPGTIAIPITICIKLPDQAIVLSATLKGKDQAGSWCVDATLATDVNLDISFSSSATFFAQQDTAPATPSDTPDLSSRDLPTDTLSPESAHALETPIGIGTKLVLHRVLRGESLELIARHYQTNRDAIVSVNYDLRSPLKAGSVIVVPANQSDVSHFPAFSTYQVTKNTSLDALIQELAVDPELFKYYNGITASKLIKKWEWVLVPHLATATP